MWDVVVLSPVWLLRLSDAIEENGQVVVIVQLLHVDFPGDHVLHPPVLHCNRQIPPFVKPPERGIRRVLPARKGLSPGRYGRPHRHRRATFHVAGPGRGSCGRSCCLIILAGRDFLEVDLWIGFLGFVAEGHVGLGPLRQRLLVHLERLVRPRARLRGRGHVETGPGARLVALHRLLPRDPLIPVLGGEQGRRHVRVFVHDEPIPNTRRTDLLSGAILGVGLYVPSGVLPVLGPLGNETFDEGFRL